jgi:hypothetical protein
MVKWHESAISVAGYRIAAIEPYRILAAPEPPSFFITRCRCKACGHSKWIHF